MPKWAPCVWAEDHVCARLAAQSLQTRLHSKQLSVQRAFQLAPRARVRLAALCTFNRLAQHGCVVALPQEVTRKVLDMAAPSWLRIDVEYPSALKDCQLQDPSEKVQCTMQ